MNRDFKGIWIPKEIWLSKELTVQEKLFYVEIDSLDNEEGCFASNGYFAEFFNISKTRVSLVIKSLIDKKYITSKIIYKEGTKEILKRVLNISYRPYLIKVKDPIQQKLKDNNINNNTINNTINNSKQFEIFWNKYNKKIDRKPCYDLFMQLEEYQVKKILQTIDKYIEINDDIKFRKSPLKYIQNECWNDELIIEEKEKEEVIRKSNILI